MRKILSLLTAILFVGSIWAADATIAFGTNDVKIDAASVTGDDSQGNSWTITTVGTTSFTANPEYYQVGSSNKPATSITFTTTLPEEVNITAFSAKFGGFKGTAGTVTLKVGETSVETGSLNAANDVTVSATPEAKGNVLTVTVTGISKGVKVYNINYSYEEIVTSNPTIRADVESVDFGTKNIFFAENKTGEVVVKVTGANLTENISAVLSGANKDNFSLSATSLDKDADKEELTISYTVEEVGDYTATLTLTSTDAEAVAIPLTLKAISKEATVYTKVMSDTELSAGDKIVIVNEDASAAAGLINDKNVLAAIDVADALDPEAGTLSIMDEEVQVFTLGGVVGAWTLTSEAGQLSSTIAKAMIADGTTTWDIEITDGNAIPSCTAGNLQYNSTTPRFTTYTSDQKPVQFYSIPVAKYAVTFTDPENGSLVIKNGETAIKSGDKFVKGTELTVVATPDEGYKAGVVSVTGATLDGATFTVGTSDVTVSATFAAISVPTALDNTAVEAKAVKSLQNGMLIIEKAGVRYNVMGQVIR